jgi:hypothetical protein
MPTWGVVNRHTGFEDNQKHSKTYGNNACQEQTLAYWTFS